MDLTPAQLRDAKARLALAALTPRSAASPICARLHFHAPSFLRPPSSPPVLTRLCSFPRVAPSPPPRSVTGEFPELITGGYPREQQGPNHLQAEGAQGDRLITFSTTWLKTDHKSLVHMGLAACTRIGTCAVVNSAIRHTTLLPANIAQLDFGSYGYKYSCFPTKKLQIRTFMTCLHFMDSKWCHTNIFMTFKYQAIWKTCLTGRFPFTRRFRDLRACEWKVLK